MRFCRKLRQLKARVLKGFDKHFWLILGNTVQLMAGFWQEIQISRWYMTLKSPFWPFLALFDPFSDVWALVEPPIRDLWSKSFKIHLATGVRDGLSHFLEKIRIFAKPYMVALCGISTWISWVSIYAYKHPMIIHIQGDHKWRTKS